MSEIRQQWWGWRAGIETRNGMVMLASRAKRRKDSKMHPKITAWMTEGCYSGGRAQEEGQKVEVARRLQSGT